MIKDITLEKLVTSTKPSACEREMYTNTYQDSDGDWVVELETNIAKYDNKCRKQGWTQKRVVYHTDGSWVSSVWIAPAKALSIRQANPTKRQMTDEQKQAMAERVKKMWQNSRDS